MGNEYPDRKIILEKVIVNNEEDMPFVVREGLLDTTAIIAGVTVAQLTAMQAAGAIGGISGGMVVAWGAGGAVGIGIAFPVLLAIPAWIGVAYGTKKYLIHRRIKKVAKEIGQKIVDNKERIKTITLYISKAGAFIGVFIPEIAIPMAVLPVVAKLLIKLGKKLSDIEIENIGRQLSLIA